MARLTEAADQDTRAFEARKADDAPERLTRDRVTGGRVLVTGGSRGLGHAVACALAREGADVAVLGRRSDALHEVSHEIEARGRRGIPVVCDVADAAACTRAVRRAVDGLGGLTAVVNGAGIDIGHAAAADMPVNHWEKTIATNLNGTYFMCRAAIPHLIAGGGGAIVNITSVAGHKAWPEDAAYNASKAGVESLTRTIAVEYAREGIRANCVAPGVIDAGLTDSVTDEAQRAAFIAMHPIGRMGTAEEVAEAVVWLISDAASFTTGSTVRVDGGFLS